MAPSVTGIPGEAAPGVGREGSRRACCRPGQVFYVEKLFLKSGKFSHTKHSSLLPCVGESSGPCTQAGIFAWKL